MEATTATLTVQELKALLSIAREKFPIRMRCGNADKLLHPNFLQSVHVPDTSGLILRNERRNLLDLTLDLSAIVQFALASGFQSLEPNRHYAVSDTGVSRTFFEQKYPCSLLRVLNPTVKIMNPWTITC